MIRKDEARSKVLDLISGSSEELELTIVDDSTIERDWGWVFFYSTKKWIETGEVQFALGGNVPYIVNRFDGSIHETGTAHSIEHYIDLYERNILENKQIAITGWEEGFEKIACTKLLRTYMKLSLSDAKSITDSILDGKSVALKPSEGIEDFQNALYEIKVVSHIEKIRGAVGSYNEHQHSP